jgi:hypothetical protein
MKVIDWPTQYPGIEFYDIQKKIITENKEKTGVFLGTGVGKTLTCLVLAEGRTLVVCPKQQKLDNTWQKNNTKFKLGKEVESISYEMLRRDWDLIDGYDTVIFDECHRVLGVLPDTRQRNRVSIPKTSQLFEATLMYLTKHPPKRMYFASATPVSKPMNLWALAKLMGKNWSFYKFRETFYFATMMGRRQVWMPRKDESTRQRLALVVQKFGYTGGLADFMDVPDQTHLPVLIPLSDDQKRALKKLNDEEADPMVKRARMRTIENGILYGKEIQTVSDLEDKMVKSTTFFQNGKIDYILERAVEFPKLFIFAAYTAQVFAISEALQKEGYDVTTVTGQTKGRDTVFEEVEAKEKGIVVVQAAVCEGYRVPSAPCMIFASKSNRFLHFDQGKGRIMDGQHLKKNLFIHLITDGGGADSDCHDNIMSGQDFQEKLSVL